MVMTGDKSCALCTHPATVLDWTPLTEWVVVEGCLCGGFFIAKPLWAQRIPSMPPAEREELGTRIRSWRARGDEAWVAALHSSGNSPIVIVSQRRALQSPTVAL
jgi:hypothetical protein